MVKFVLIFILFVLMAVSNAKRKHSWLSPSSFLIVLYTLSLLFTIIDIPMNDHSLVLQDKYWGPAIFMTVMVIAFLFPILRFNETKFAFIRVPSRRILDTFSTIIIILSFFSIFYYIPTMLNLLRGDLGALRNALYAGEEYVEAGLWNTVASTSASLYVFAILMFFIYLCIGTSKGRLILLFISSFSEPIHVLTYVGRDGIVFWFFSFIYLFLLFRPFLRERVGEKIKKVGFILGVVMMIPFMMISVGRFSENFGVLNSIVSYFGQPFVNGTLYFGIDNPPVSPGNSFPLFYEITGIRMPEGAGRWEMGGTNSWVFGTFVESWYSSFGSYSALIFSCIVLGMLFFAIFNKRMKSLRFSKLFIYIVYFQVYAQGVFYFRQYTRGGNLFILLCFFMALAFNILQKSGKPIVIERINQK